MTYEDIKQLGDLRDQTVIVVKAPTDTKLEVSDPDEVCVLSQTSPEAMRLFSVLLSVKAWAGFTPVDLHGSSIPRRMFVFVMTPVHLETILIDFRVPVRDFQMEVPLSRDNPLRNTSQQGLLQI